jgi:hypothetical protein
MPEFTVPQRPIHKPHDHQGITRLQQPSASLEPGRLPDGNVRSAMVPRLTFDFSQVPVHSGDSPAAARRQAKLVTSAPGDALEQEADHVADRLVGGAFGTPAAPTAMDGENPVPDGGEDVVRLPGHALDASTRGLTERLFGQGFSQVRVHTDDQAARAARGLGARAFTVGSHIVFGADTFAPATRNGQHLLAHELTHVVQQTAADHTGVLGVAQLQRQAQRPFSEQRIEDVRSAYEENAQAAVNDPNDRAACIVMLNVAVGRLLGMKTRPHPARTGSTRTVDMPRLTTDTVDKAMAQLVKKGLAERPIRIRFLDTRGRTAGTLAPQTMEGSAQAEVLGRTTGTGWYGFGLSIPDGYHSVLLLVDATSDQPTIYWLDQFSTGIDDDVTDTLDDLLLIRTKDFWEHFRADHAATGKRSNTWTRIWPLRGNVAP